MVKLNKGDRIGHYPYRILQPLGNNHGNMAEVFLATESDTEKPPSESLVVIKISRAQGENEEFFRDTIKNEAERLRELRHEGIVRILPLKTTTEVRQAAYEGRATALPGSPWFLVLEYLEGGSLRELLAIHKQLDITFALEVARQLAKTLDHIHRQTHVHLDIKPENILFRHRLGSGAPLEPVLIDFGIARNVGQTGLEASTLVYAPPERVQQNRSAPETMPRPDPSMDVYSLGVVLYQMITGRRPFDGRGTKHISTAILKGNPTIPSTYSRSISPELDEIILQALDKNPSQRPTAGELELQLSKLIHKLSNDKFHAPNSFKISEISAIPHHRRRWKFLRFPSVTPALYALTILLLLAFGGQAAVRTTTGNWWVPSAANMQQVPAQLTGFVNGLLLGPEPTPTLIDNERFIVNNSEINGGSDGNNSNINTEATVVTHNTPSTSLAFADGTEEGKSIGEMQAQTEAEQEETTGVVLTVSVAANTSTVMPLPLPTVTATPMPVTSTPVPDIAPPANTGTARSSVVTEPSKTRSSAATSTPVPDFTPTATATQTLTPVPAQPTATRVVAPPTKPPQNRTVTLVAPDENASGRGRIDFRWAANFTLGPDEAFEPIFWREGEDPLVSGKGWGGPTTGDNLVISFDQVAPDNYMWGVLLIKTAPSYQRIQFLGSSRHFSLQGSGDSNSDGASRPD